jgi:6-phosphogluconate dehydrogenase (decarboxylating)
MEHGAAALMRAGHQCVVYDVHSATVMRSSKKVRWAQTSLKELAGN